MAIHSPIWVHVYCLRWHRVRARWRGLGYRSVDPDVEPWPGRRLALMFETLFASMVPPRGVRSTHEWSGLRAVHGRWLGLAWGLACAVLVTASPGAAQNPRSPRITSTDEPAPVFNPWSLEVAPP